jgi:hypothetical protein
VGMVYSYTKIAPKNHEPKKNLKISLESTKIPLKFCSRLILFYSFRGFFEFLGAFYIFREELLFET